MSPDAIIRTCFHVASNLFTFTLSHLALGNHWLIFHHKITIPSVTVRPGLIKSAQTLALSMKDFTANNAKFQPQVPGVFFVPSVLPYLVLTQPQHGGSGGGKGSRCICKVITPNGFQWRQSQAAQQAPLAPFSFKTIDQQSRGYLLIRGRSQTYLFELFPFSPEMDSTP